MCYSSHAPKVLHLHDPGPDTCHAPWSSGAAPKHVSAWKNQRTTSATSVIAEVGLLQRYKTIIQADRRFYDVSVPLLFSHTSFGASSKPWRALAAGLTFKPSMSAWANLGWLLPVSNLMSQKRNTKHMYPKWVTEKHCLKQCFFPCKNRY